MLTMRELVALSGASRDAINGWLPEMTSDAPSTTQGVTREFTRENGLEICFVAALSRAKQPLRHCFVAARAWLDMESTGSLPAFWAWNSLAPIVEGTTIKGLRISKGKMPVEAIFYDLAEPVASWGPSDGEATKPNMVSIIPLADIVRKVDAVEKWRATT
jgi:hypothetical protein